MKTYLPLGVVLAIGAVATSLSGADINQIAQEAERAAVETAKKIELGDVLVWLITGALAGYLAAALFTRSKAGFGTFANLAVGLLGALLGGFAMSGLGIELGLGAFVLEYDNLLAAFVGSCVLIGALCFLRRRKPEHEAKK